MTTQSAINAGLFVQFVANEWKSTSNTTDLNGMEIVDATGAPIIAGQQYTVTSTIYASDLITDFDLAKGCTKGYTTIGIVAQNTADPSDIVIALRGTNTIWEWVQDAKFLLRSFSKVAGCGYAEDGFVDMYLSFSLTPAPPDADFLTAVKAILPSPPIQVAPDPLAPPTPPAPRITVAGHSLGAALATLLALDLAANSTYPVTLYTFASPRVGDMHFAHLFNHVVPNAYRIANRLDIVPKVPPPLLYEHVGDETEVIPGSQLKFDLACEHHLTSYFNMLGALIGQSASYPIQTNCLKGDPGTPSKDDV